LRPSITLTVPASLPVETVIRPTITLPEEA
jgi:hypothetical protein